MAAIMAGSCFFFPALTGCLPALVLTSAFAVLIGLEVALPPINPEDDWVPMREGENRLDASLVREAPVRRKAVKAARAQLSPRLPLQPIHAARGHSVPVQRILQPGQRYHHTPPVHRLAPRYHSRHHDNTVPHSISHN